MIEKCRILSLDGSSLSGGTGFISAELLRQVDNRLKDRGVRDPRDGFLNWVDFFAGSSAGGLNALYLGMHERPNDALDTIHEFWTGVIDATLSPTLTRMVGATAGQNAMFSTTRLRQFFFQTFKHPETGKPLKLRDLPQHVIITSFQLDHEEPASNRDRQAATPFRSWKPKVFRNYPDSEPDRDELVVDVALRTCSPPILMPIYHSHAGTGPGYLDGGVLTNNPAMIAVADVIREMGTGGFIWNQRAHYQSQQKEAITPGHKYLDDILLFSVGNGRTPTYVASKAPQGMADWGYAPWLLNPLAPLLLINLFLQCDIQAINFQCEKLLGDNYCRMDPQFPYPINTTDSREMAAKLAELVALPQTETQSERVFRWFDRHVEEGGVHDHWFHEPTPALSCD